MTAAAPARRERLTPARRERLTPAQYVRRYGPARRLDRLVLLDIAERADYRYASWGEHAYPRVGAIAERIGYCERSVQYALRRLTAGDNPYLELNERPGRTHVCRILRPVEPLGSVDTQPEPPESAVDNRPRSVDDAVDNPGSEPPAGPAQIAPGGAKVAPDLVALTERSTPLPPRSGWREIAGAAAPTQPAAPSAPPTPAGPSGSSPPSPPTPGATPHRGDAGAGRVPTGAAASSGDPPPALYAVRTGEHPVPRASRDLTRQLRPCPRCAAPPGEPCRTRAGHRRVANHAERRAPRL